jgi:hypothetical protein
MRRGSFDADMKAVSRRCEKPHLSAHASQNCDVVPPKGDARAAPPLLQRDHRNAIGANFRRVLDTANS